MLMCSATSCGIDDNSSVDSTYEEIIPIVFITKATMLIWGNLKNKSVKAENQHDKERLYE